MAEKRTITLSDRPPVTVNEEDWGFIAVVRDSEHDGQVEYQANSKSKWFLGVRQHDDGRTIVYATYYYSTNWQNARDFSAKHGVMLPKDCTTDDICKAIKEVANRMESCEAADEDNKRWSSLADACIADMPAEELV